MSFPLKPMASLLAVILATCAPNGGGDTFVLDKPEARLGATFPQLSNVVEAPGGRIFFADTKGKVFLSADLGTGKVDTVGVRVDTIGHGGTDSAQYKFPGVVAKLAGDTVALVDFASERTTLWSGAGRYLGVMPIAPVRGITPPLVYDAVGHGYKVDYQAVLGGGEPGGAFRPDSISVLRINRSTGLADTIARLSAPEYGEARAGEQVQTVPKIFGPTDLFGATPDGAVWVARAHSNSLDWRATDGTWTRGDERGYRKVPVTKKDRERFMERMKQQGLPQGVEVSFPFADTKPPFELGATTFEGEVWLQMSHDGEDTPITYEVFGPGGKFVRNVRLPAGALLAGFGADGAVYATVRAADGTKTIARFRVR